MEVKLKKLTLRNFKGLRDFSLSCPAPVTEVRGDNEAGKTTLNDAYLWLWTGKDSLNQANFPIKPISKRTGKELQGLEHEVEGEFLIDGTPRTFKKILVEKWTKKKGSTKKIFSGHTNKYFVNDVPTPEKDYKAELYKIVPDEMFKLLSDLRYFPVTLHWEKRRKLLMDAFGGVTDEQTLSLNPKLAPLAELLNGNTVEQFRKIVKARQKKVNNELDDIPIRISEAERSLPDTKGLSRDEIAKTLERIQTVVREKEAELLQLQMGNGVISKMNQLGELQAIMQTIKNQAAQERQDKILKKQGEFNELQNEITNIGLDISRKEDVLKEKNLLIQTLEKKLQELRERFHEVSKTDFSYDPEMVCPTCKQKLPEEQVEAARQQAREEFNHKKSQQMEEIREKGTENRRRIESLRLDVERFSSEIAELLKVIKTKEQQVANLETEICNLHHAEIAVPQEYDDLMQRANKLQQEIEDIKAGQGTDEQQETIRREIDSWNAQADELARDLAALDQAETTRQRIKDLEYEQLKLASEYEQLESQMYLCDTFDLEKAEMLEEKVNSQFKLARFKMFNLLINGGIEPCCEITYKGVPWDGLNSGHRTIVALDIIDTLAEHYKMRLPVFIDNAESVTDIPDIKSQVIKLIKPDIQTAEDRKKYRQLVVA